MICPRYLNLFQKQKAIFVEEQSRDFESTKNKVHCTFMRCLDRARACIVVLFTSMSPESERLKMAVTIQLQ